MQIEVPSKVSTIINTLTDNGFEAYAVGGCVRDSYLGLTPNDWDITTNALPAQVKELFRRTVDIGIEHGTVKVMMGNDGYEVTTYRIDGEYEDCRHPKNVTFTSKLEEDLKRRDFTINAMAYSERTGLVDLFGGIDDIEAGVIRAVGDPVERFTEDALRILRALRFSARFDYDIEAKTKEAIISLAPNLSNISAERIRDELEKLICSDNPDRLRWAYIFGVTSVIFPEWDDMMKCMQTTPHHYTDVGDHTIGVLEYIVTCYPDISKEDDRVLRLAALLHDIAKPACRFTGPDGIDHFTGHPAESEKMALFVMQRLKYDNDTINRVRKLVRYHDDTPEAAYPAVRRFIIAAGAENMENLIRLKYADIYAHTGYRRAEKLRMAGELDKMYRKVLSDGDCLSVKQLAVNGHDLMACGIKDGPKIGEALNFLLEKVLDDPGVNEKDTLLKELGARMG
ncbi:MAG: HD domain-containing protein [Lachnospiraceae bacterium]|nr:HD domain-containing protein [Lachnospiraceae bacterium]